MKRTRLFLLAVVAFLLGVLLYTTYHPISAPSLSLSSLNVLPDTAIILDLGILLLILYEDFGKPFYLRPKPVIEHVVKSSEPLAQTTQEEIRLMGNPLSLAGVPCARLWVTVTNRGRSPVKQMRARVRVHTRTVRNHPVGLDFTDLWLKQYEAPFPYVKTSRGITPVAWTQFQGAVSYETDMAPMNDMVASSVISVLSFADPILYQKFNQALRQTMKQPIVIMIGQSPIILSLANLTVPLRPEEIFTEFGIRFWIVAENLHKSFSRIFRVQIPADFNTIICETIDKNHKDYKVLNEELSS